MIKNIKAASAGKTPAFFSSQLLFSRRQPAHLRRLESYTCPCRQPAYATSWTSALSQEKGAGRRVIQSCLLTCRCASTLKAAGPKGIDPGSVGAGSREVRYYAYPKCDNMLCIGYYARPASRPFVHINRVRWLLQTHLCGHYTRFQIRAAQTQAYGAPQSVKVLLSALCANGFKDGTQQYLYWHEEY